MSLAYILINSEIGKEQEVLKQLQEIPNLVEAHVVYGIYDIIAKVAAEDMTAIKQVVTDSLKNLTQIRSTMTLICVEA
ncbi:MAG: Lrp/AsnC family transcriptional regulator [Candidatus Heimdallarchaeaceae archaeon]